MDFDGLYNGRSRDHIVSPLILDSGGVLIRPDGALIAENAARLGIEVSPERAVVAIHVADRNRDVGPHGGRPFAVHWAQAVGCTAALAIRLWDEVLAAIAPTRLWSVANPDAVRFLRELDPSVRRFVVTNSEGDAHHELRLCGLRGLVDGVLDSTQVGIDKPDPRLFQMAATAMGVAMADCVYVSDTLDAPVEPGFTQVLYDPFDVYRDVTGLPVAQRINSLAQLRVLPMTTALAVPER